jgi:soluble lytic murein transglycosylase
VTLLIAVAMPLRSAESAPKGRGKAITVMDRDWQKTFTLMKNKDPVAAKLLTWIYATETNIPLEAKNLMKFVDENPDWPRLSDFREKIEESISSSKVSPHETAEWFRRNPPQSYDGLKAYVAALKSFGEGDEIGRVVSKFWRVAAMERNETAAASAQYRQYLAPADHAARLDRMIWDGRYSEAEYMLAFVGPETRAEGQARIALARNKAKAVGLLNAVPAKLQNDEGMLYERARWHRRRNEDARALSVIDAAMHGPMQHPETWWTEQNTLARRAIEDHDFAKAYDIASHHRLKDGVEYAQAEWLLGWLDLRYMNRPGAALKRFGDLYGRVGSAISKARAAYWAARAADVVHMKYTSTSWDEAAAGYLSTYYGQLSYGRLHGAAKPGDVGEAAPSQETVQAFEKNELVHAVRILQRTGLEQCFDSFLAKIVALAKTNDDYHLAARLAHETGHEHYAVQANKDAQQKLGGWILKDGYPTLLHAPDKPEKALVHAIIYRESMFNQNAVSAAGAMGLMQLMPATAKAYSKKQKERFRKDKLTADPRYNMRLGAAYLANMIDQYNGSVPVAIAVYNAGPGNMAEWMRTFGTPGKRDIDIVDWIELIPNYETRNYVQRVMESWYMYRLKFREKPLTVADFD